MISDPVTRIKEYLGELLTIVQRLPCLLETDMDDEYEKHLFSFITDGTGDLEKVALLLRKYDITLIKANSGTCSEELRNSPDFETADSSAQPRF